MFDLLCMISEILGVGTLVSTADEGSLLEDTLCDCTSRLPFKGMPGVLCLTRLFPITGPFRQFAFYFGPAQL